MEKIENKILAGERALFMGHDLEITGCRFEKGESPLKEGRDLKMENCTFGWKYPLWYCSKVEVNHSTWELMGRAGVWYTKDITVQDSRIEAPKNFRKCENVTLRNVQFPNAQETLWWNDGVQLENVEATGDYFCMNSRNVTVTGLTLHGNYPFDGCENVTVRSSNLESKDSFWNCRHVHIIDSTIEGEYIAWNSDDVTLENCTVKSLQGFCYVRHLTLRNCRLLGTSLAFEYADVDAEITDGVDSVIDPSSGTISAPRIGELILEPEKVDLSRTVFHVPVIEHRYDHNIYEGVVLDV